MKTKAELIKEVRNLIALVSAVEQDVNNYVLDTKDYDEYEKLSGATWTSSVFATGRLSHLVELLEELEQAEKKTAA